MPARIAPETPEHVSKVLYALSPSTRAADFYRGLIDTSHIAFFLLASVVFLTVAAVILQSRRWR